MKAANTIAMMILVQSLSEWSTDDMPDREIVIQDWFHAVAYVVKIDTPNRMLDIDTGVGDMLLTDSLLVCVYAGWDPS